MNVWIAENTETHKRLAASSDANLRAKILAADGSTEGDWKVTYGETGTTQARVIELIEGGKIIERTLSTAVYRVADGKVSKVKGT